MPCPIRSWSASQRLPSGWLSILALAAISSELTSASTSAGTTRELSSSSDGQPGQYSDGKPARQFPPHAARRGPAGGLGDARRCEQHHQDHRHARDEALAEDE